MTENHRCDNCGQNHPPHSPADIEQTKRVQAEGERLYTLAVHVLANLADKSVPHAPVQAVIMSRLLASCILTRTVEKDAGYAVEWMKLLFSLLQNDLSNIGIKDIGFGVVQINNEEAPNAQA